jgi:hypothetical protein
VGLSSTANKGVLVVNVSRRFLALPVALSLAGSLAAAEGFSLSKLNPFASEEKAKPKPKAKSNANKTTNKDSSWLKWPFSTSAKKPAPKKTTKPEPSTWNKMTSGTKRLFSNTKNALTPGESKPAAKSNTATGLAGRSTGSRTAKKEESKNIFASWFKPTEPEPPKKPPQRPSDWVGGERP